MKNTAGLLLENAWIDASIDGVILPLPDLTQKGFKGTAGWFDWRLQGRLSHLLKAGAFSAKKETPIFYFPVPYRSRTLPLLFIAQKPSTLAWKKNLTTLGHSKPWGASLSEFEDKIFSKGDPVWTID